MLKVKKTSVFDEWLLNLKDKEAKSRINRFLQRISKSGLSGDIEPVGEGISEIRFHFGPGYRVYFVQRGNEIVVILGGGTKKTQSRDIAEAKKLASCITG